MKLRLLNASHLAISGLGALSRYETVEETTNDPAIRHYMGRLMDKETGPLLAPVPGVDLAQYKATLIARFQNAAIRDTVERINRDAAINLLLDPLRDALAKDAPIDLLALALAAWCRRTSNELAAGKTIIGANANPDLQALRTADPLALLSIESLFGDLGRNAQLTSSVRSWLEQFNAAGVAATLERL
jgi:mannitol 2-dehydrogenase